MSSQQKKEEGAADAGLQAPPEPRLKERYRKEIAPALMREFGHANIMEAPRLSKIIISMGVGAATQDSKILDAAVEDLAIIAGQRPTITRSKRSIAQFKVRQHNPVGCKVTLRGNRMYEFLDRLISTALPRIRDFRGMPPDAVDGRGNYNLGLREQTVFPEIDLDRVSRIQGMNVTIVTTARNDEECLALLREFGFPFREA
jgi:large subunit ribosomal protein L5